jgi:hypothetical protein
VYNFKLSSDSGDSGIKKCKREYDGGVMRSPRLTEVWSQVFGFIWQESALSRCEDISTLHLFIENFYQFCTLNAAMECITIQHGKSLFPLIFTGHSMLVTSE